MAAADSLTFVASMAPRQSRAVWRTSRGSAHSSRGSRGGGGARGAAESPLDLAGELIDLFLNSALRVRADAIRAAAPRLAEHGARGQSATFQHSCRKGNCATDTSGGRVQRRARWPMRADPARAPPAPGEGERRMHPSTGRWRNAASGSTIDAAARVGGVVWSTRRDPRATAAMSRRVPAPRR